MSKTNKTNKTTKANATATPSVADVTLSRAVFAGAKSHTGADVAMTSAVVAAAKVWGTDVDAYNTMMNHARAAYIAGACAAMSGQHVEFKDFTATYSSKNIERAVAILKRADPAGKSNDKRTEAEQKVYRAAITAWNRLLESAGVAKPEAKKRQPSVSGSKAQAAAAKKAAAAKAAETKKAKALIDQMAAGIQTGTLPAIKIARATNKKSALAQYEFHIAALCQLNKCNGRHITSTVINMAEELRKTWAAEYPHETE